MTFNKMHVDTSNIIKVYKRTIVKLSI